MEWRRILKPGGISAHIAGLADHRDFSKPYEYLKLKPAAWRRSLASVAPRCMST